MCVCVTTYFRCLRCGQVIRDEYSTRKCPRATVAGKWRCNLEDCTDGTVNRLLRWLECIECQTEYDRWQAAVAAGRPYYPIPPFT